MQNNERFLWIFALILCLTIEHDISFIAILAFLFCLGHFLKIDVFKKDSEE